MRPAGLIGFAPLDRRGGGVLVGGLTVGNEWFAEVQTRGAERPDRAQLSRSAESRGAFEADVEAAGLLGSRGRRAGIARRARQRPGRANNSRSSKEQLRPPRLRRQLGQRPRSKHGGRDERCEIKPRPTKSALHRPKRRERC